jgi:hypothetical protein
MSTLLIGSKWWVTTQDGKLLSMKHIETDDTSDDDEVVYCTGTVTEYQIKELKRRIASGTTTAEDVVLLERLLYERTRVDN